MLTLTDLTLRRGPRKLLEDVNLTVHDGEHVGIVGRNGTGKSSLFALILGTLEADTGSVRLPSGRLIATVAQETPALEQSAIDFVLDGDAELRDVERRLADAESREDGHAQADLHERLLHIDGYAAPARAARLLYGLGFASGDETRAVGDFSGGWRMRLNLARALMCRSDILLLDEPTNHLDLDAVLWLQGWLSSYAGLLMVISHDRDFLDGVTTHTIHLEGGRATLYRGNYSAFEKTRAERLAQQAAEYKTQARRQAHLQKFVDRFRAKATKARQAQSRLKQIEKMELTEPAHWDSPFDFSFPEPERMPAPLVNLEKADAGYGETRILRGLNFSLHPGDRIGLLGRNGAGKSTLIRTLMGELPTLAGNRFGAPDLKIGYFAQHQLEQLDRGASPLLHLQRMDPSAREQSLRGFLGGFDFSGDRALEAVGPFSGGEKARLALAMVVYARPNLLLLDEPTNHLDLEMRHALELALQSFEGAMVLVAHDRHLLDTTCDVFWRIAGGECQPFDGSLDDYSNWMRSKDSANPVSDNRNQKANGKAQKKAAITPAERKKHRAELSRLEREMEQRQQELATLEERMADPALYEGDSAEIVRLTREQSELRTALESMEERWLQLSESV